MESPTRHHRPPLERSLERNLDKEDFPPPQVAPLPPLRTAEEVMEELREVTYQYANVPDPVESAARRQRILDGEVLNLMEQTAAGIIAREQETHQAYLATTGIETITEMEVEGQQLPSAPIELPQASQHSKRRGRPPKPKQREIRLSPKVFKGSSSRKRNLTNSAASSASPAGLINRSTDQQARRTNRTGSNSAGASSTSARPPTQHRQDQGVGDWRYTGGRRLTSRF
ncbi:Uncharacterized protein Rs2_11250 [Raphanus sativus]|nr:Uncharacterized protein Rs2_11250 [Raphanus sativus]